MRNLKPFPKAQKWFDVRNVTAEAADVYIYDVVGDSWVGTDAKSFVTEIAQHKNKLLNVHLNSPGGSVFEGVAIFTALKNHVGGVVTKIDGLAASIASIIALAGDRVVMADNAMMMIHNPMSFTFGSSDQLRKDADVLDKIKDTLVNTYVSKTGKGRDDVSKAMDEETWFTAEEAQQYGLVDEVVGGVAAMNQIPASVAEAFNFHRVPEAVLKTEAKEPPPSSVTPRSLFLKRQALTEKTQTW